MGNTIDWNALPLVVEMVGATDIELLMRHLLTIRQHVNKPRD